MTLHEKLLDICAPLSVEVILLANIVLLCFTLKPLTQQLHSHPGPVRLQPSDVVHCLTV